MSIFDYIADEFRKNGGIYLKKVFHNIYVEYRLGGITEYQAMTECEEEFDKLYTIYK